MRYDQLGGLLDGFLLDWFWLITPDQLLLLADSSFGQKSCKFCKVSGGIVGG
jgi:hypothetical protein